MLPESTTIMSTALEITETMVRSGAVDIIVVDSEIGRASYVTGIT